jgi:hypothetical protein
MLLENVSLRSENRFQPVMEAWEAIRRHVNKKGKQNADTTLEQRDLTESALMTEWRSAQPIIDCNPSDTAYVESMVSIAYEVAPIECEMLGRAVVALVIRGEELPRSGTGIDFGDIARTIAAIIAIATAGIKVLIWARGRKSPPKSDLSEDIARLVKEEVTAEAKKIPLLSGRPELLEKVVERLLAKK